MAKLAGGHAQKLTVENGPLSMHVADVRLIFGTADAISVGVARVLDELLQVTDVRPHAALGLRSRGHPCCPT
ncbi:MAG: hypothetical protein EHM55_17715 [Acidobacteria bacterium]|nr:MAG: hypothetical protein EHM55_17715 [Acidobacteriota bacterium]